VFSANPLLHSLIKEQWFSLVDATGSIC